MPEYDIAHLDQIEPIDYRECRLLRVRHDLGITSFGVNAWSARAVGDRLVPEHVEDDGRSNEELYLVQRGRARFELDGESRDATAGTLVLVKAGVTRTAFAEEPDTIIVVVGGTPGQAFTPRGWEAWAPLVARYEAGDHEAVVEGLQAAIDAGATYPVLFYNLACCESLTGRTESALAHLRQAIEGSEEFREYARSDTDLDPIRNEPAFEELVG